MYEIGSTGRCPHCGFSAMFIAPNLNPLIGVGYKRERTRLLATSEKESVSVYSSVCPKCHKVIVVLKTSDGSGKVLAENLVYPMNVNRLVPPEVPSHIKNDFVQAASVLPISGAASAALSRRCLENVLIENGFNRRGLSEKIDDALPMLPLSIAENLDAIRTIGNFAAHPLKSQSTGLIVDVEPEEANWILDVLEDLFNVYYVQPKRAEEKRKKLNDKLKDLGKPPMKKA